MMKLRIIVLNSFIILSLLPTISTKSVTTMVVKFRTIYCEIAYHHA
jgi:hypothetical protein